MSMFSINKKSQKLYRIKLSRGQYASDGLIAYNLLV